MDKISLNNAVLELQYLINNDPDELFQQAVMQTDQEMDAVFRRAGEAMMAQQEAFESNVNQVVSGITAIDIEEHGNKKLVALKQRVADLFAIAQKLQDDLTEAQKEFQTQRHCVIGLHTKLQELTRDLNAAPSPYEEQIRNFGTVVCLQQKELQREH